MATGQGVALTIEAALKTAIHKWEDERVKENRYPDEECILDYDVQVKYSPQVAGGVAYVVKVSDQVTFQPPKCRSLEELKIQFPNIFN